MHARLEEEEDQWKKVSFRYEEYSKRFSQAMEKRVTEATSMLSSKAKGKQRQIEADEDLDEMLPDPHDLAPDLRKSLDLARSVLLRPSTTNPNLGSSSAILTTLRGAKVTRTELITTIDTLLQDVTYKLDRLHTFVSAARTTTRVAEEMLNERFKLLVDNLEKRRVGSPEPSGTRGGVDVVKNYVKKEVAPLHVQDVASSSAVSGRGGGIMDLMRALSRVDTARHPSKIGDSVRRAAREVQRIGENRGGVGDRRLTAVYPPGILSGGNGGGGGGAGSGHGSGVMTPRKVPGTPRRHGTPGRDRERTPGR